MLPRLPRLLRLHGRGVVGASLGTVDPKTRVQIPAPALEVLTGMRMVNFEPFMTFPLLFRRCEPQRLHSERPRLTRLCCEEQLKLCKFSEFRHL